LNSAWVRPPLGSASRRLAGGAVASATGLGRLLFMRVLIVGCGYVGLRLGTELARQGHEVFGLRRTRFGEAELKAAGVSLLTADITAMADLQQLPSPFDWVVNTVAPHKGGVEEYRKVYLHGMRNLVAWLKPAPPNKFVYTSSTSVYGQADGSQVDEHSATAPPNETSQILLEAEEVLREAARSVRPSPRPSPIGLEAESGALPLTSLPAVILRVAGIYGPGRGYWFHQYVRGEAVITDGGKRMLNMIHRDDVAGLIIAALKRGQPGETYNAVDDEPVAQIDFFRWLSQALGREMPPFATEAKQSARKRGFSDKRVSNVKLRTQLGYTFQYPTFRQGFAEEIEQLKLMPGGR